MEGLESFFTSGQQTFIFLMSFLFGFPVGMAYDVFRVIRMTVPHGRIAVIIEDMLFFMLYAVFLMCFTSAFARSEFRFYYPVGNLLGFVMYYMTIGNIVIGIIGRIIDFLKRLFGRPLKKIALICKKIAFKFVRSLQNININKKISKIDLIESSDMLYNSSIESIEKERKKECEKIVSKKG